MADETRTRRTRRTLSLRGQLTWLVAALAIPMVLLQGYWGYHDYRSARHFAERDALAYADAIKLGLQQFLSQAEDAITATAEQFGADWMTSSGCAAHMRTMTQLNPYLANAVMVGPYGDVICSALHDAPDIDATEWPWWESMLQRPRYMVADPVEGDITNSWILPLVAPLPLEEGVFQGAIVGSVQLTELNRLSGSPSLPDDHLVTLATSDRRVIARSVDADEWIGRFLPADNGTERVVGPGRSVATGGDLLGVQRTWGQISVGPGWTLYVGVDDDLVYGPAIAEAASHMGLTLLVVLLAMVLASRNYARIERALQQLAERTATAASGAMVPLPAGTPAEVTAIVNQFNRTLEARDKAQGAEQRAMARYQSIFDNAVFGIYVSTPDGRFLQVNPALVSMLGYDSEAELIDAGPDALYANASLREELVTGALETGEIEARELEWLRADSVPITIRLSGKMIMGRGGDPVFEMIVQDITEEKRTEDELRQTQKMEAIGKLAGGVAHDFNNLLTVIGGNVELLEDDLPEDEDLRTDLSQIAKATKRAMSLTRRLLTFSRRQRRGEQVLDINEVVPDLEKMLVPLIGEDLTLETVLGPGPIPISIDPGELEQVMLNLVLNARDAMPGGGVVRIETRRTKTDAFDTDEADEQPLAAMLAVTDNGIGMDEVTRPRIFEPFYTTKPMGEGTGLGLSTVYGIVKRAGGAIQVESAPGEGTRMELWFPLAFGEDMAEAPRVLADPPVGDETILVVEDDELVQTFVRRALTDAGFAVHVADHGQAALDLLRTLEEPPDLVLTDVVMPGVSGPDLAERLALAAPGLPVLFMSGYIDNSFLGRALEEEPDLLLRKPFSAAELRSRVRTVLDRSSTSTHTSLNS